MRQQTCNQKQMHTIKKKNENEKVNVYIKTAEENELGK